MVLRITRLTFLHVVDLILAVAGGNFLVSLFVLQRAWRGVATAMVRALLTWRTMAGVRVHAFAFRKT